MEGDLIMAYVRHARTDACVKAYSAKYDRYLCKACKVWVEPPCSCTGSECPFPGAPQVPDDDIVGEAEVLRGTKSRARFADEEDETT